jgi:hypothetical protein
MQVTRERIVEALRSAVEPLPFVHAMWEAGSASCGRLDAWSDIDLQLDVDPERLAETFALVEAALEELSPIAQRFALPEPTWHGHSQRFYILRDASPYLMLDLVIMRHAQGERFSDVELHGAPVVYFDKSGVATPTHLDQVELEGKLAQRVEQLRATFPLFQPLVTKEVLREHPLDALACYNSLTIRPLVELLRIRHCPARYSFGSRYLYYDLPAEIVRHLELLCYVASVDELESKRQGAQAMFEATLAEIDAASQA